MKPENPMLSLFKEQLNNECNDLLSRHGLESAGQSLIWWYFTRLHNFSPAEVEEIVCDGGGDLGIDAIWTDENEVVRFYQFKNSQDIDGTIKAGDIDKVISGLKIIFSQRYKSIANEALRARVEDQIKKQVPRGYRIHIVSSGQGVPHEAAVKLDALTDELSHGKPGFFRWHEERAQELHDAFYQKKLPAIEQPINFDCQRAPYIAQSASRLSYFFHATGKFLAELYEQHGEELLQRNIRVDQGDTPTNRSIELTCSEADSGNFLHFNNGVTFLCFDATYDLPNMKMRLEKAQVVNGGQTIRALYRARKKGKLKPDVLVPVRAITSQGDKEFGSNVAVNQNNQNQMGTGFLRSNDPKVIQLGHALSSMGWYLERREGELASATREERAALEHRIGRTLEDHVIKLKEGLQAYVATYFEQPELAKKNAKKIFQGADEGGFFEAIFSNSNGKKLTAENLVIAHQIRCYVDSFIMQFAARKRRRDRIDDWVEDYRKLIGNIVDLYPAKIDQVIPQSSIFLCGSIFQDCVKIRGMDPRKLPDFLAADRFDLIREHLYQILTYAEKNPKKANKAWPTLLKSKDFFNNFISYLQGVRTGSQT
jgi:hypothetical protein